MKRIGLSAFLLAYCLISVTARAQWTEPVRIGIPGAYYYPQILAAGDSLHVVGTNIPGGDKIVYLRSDDAGDTWGDSRILSDTLNSTNAMFVRIVKDGQHVMVLWRSIMDSGPGPWNIGYALSDDNGDTWTEPLYVLNPGWDHILYFSASGSGPVVNVIVSRSIGYDLIFYTVRSTDFGENWSEPEILFTCLDIGVPDQAASEDFVHLVWPGNLNQSDYWETYYISSSDGGLSWSDNEIVTEDDESESTRPSVFAAADNSVLLSWMDLKYSPYWFTGDVFFRKSTDSGHQWQMESQVTANHHAKRSDVAGNRDRIRLAWEDEREDNGGRSIYYNESEDGGITWGNEVRLDLGTEESRNPALATSNAGVYVVWADDRCEPDSETCGGLYFTRREQPTPIPTVSAWGMLILALLLIAVGTATVVRSHRANLKIEGR
jgi:hypothetical protein